MRKKYLLVRLVIITCSLVLLSNSVYAKNPTMIEVNAKGIENIELDVGKSEIIFDKSSSKIYLSDELKTSQTGTTLRIYDQQSTSFFGWFKQEEHKIIIGTAKDYAKVDVDGGGIEVRGALAAEQIVFDGGGMDINADLTAEEIKIDGGGIELKGTLAVKKLLVDGGGMTLDIGVKKTENLEINGGGMSVDIKYLDSWTGARYLTVDGAGSSINLLVPSSNNSNKNGQLDVKTDGIIDVNVDYY